MKRRLGAIQTVLRKRKREVPAKGDWLALHREWGVGRQQGARIMLSHDDRDAMRQRAIDLYGVDPKTLDMEKDRTAMSMTTSNEKLSRQRAFGRMLRVALPGHGITIALPGSNTDEQVVIPTPPGVMLSVEPSQLRLDTSHVSRVLVIENAEIVERWWELMPYLPEEWRKNTLVAYRGHRQDLRSLQDWIASYSDHITLGFYGDFDPYGVRIGLRSYAPLVPPERFWLIGPDDVSTIPVQVNKADTFATHESALRYLEKHQPDSPGACSLIKDIRQGRWAVTQEALLAHKIRLTGHQ